MRKWAFYTPGCSAKCSAPGSQIITIVNFLRPWWRVVQGGLCHGSRAEKLTHCESRIFIKSEHHANDPLRAYVYVLCLSPTELYFSDTSD